MIDKFFRVLLVAVCVIVSVAGLAIIPLVWIFGGLCLAVIVYVAFVVAFWGAVLDEVIKWKGKKRKEIGDEEETEELIH